MTIQSAVYARLFLFHSYTRMLYCMSCYASYTLHYYSDLHPFFYLFIGHRSHCCTSCTPTYTTAEEIKIRSQMKKSSSSSSRSYSVDER